MIIKKLVHPTFGVMDKEYVTPPDIVSMVKGRVIVFYVAIQIIG